MQRVRKDSDTANVRHYFVQQLKALSVQLRRHEANAGCVVERMSQVFGDAQGYRISAKFINGRDRSAALDNDPGRRCVSDNDLNVFALQLVDQRGYPFRREVGEQQIEYE
jgi:hypothetical protein